MIIRDKKHAALVARRNKLVNTRHSVQFYGGWYSVDNVTGLCDSAATFAQALDIAEKGNKA